MVRAPKIVPPQTVYSKEESLARLEWRKRDPGVQGRRRPRGSPSKLTTLGKIPPKTKYRKIISITAEDFEYALDVGEGSLSKGVRAALGFMRGNVDGVAQHIAAQLAAKVASLPPSESPKKRK